MMGWWRLRKVKDTQFADLWGWSFGQFLRLLAMYSSILLEEWALFNTQLFGFGLALIWLILIIRIRIRENDPVGYPIYLILKFIKCIKGWKTKKNLARKTYQLYHFPLDKKEKIRF
jgi:hypothetical protein